MSAKKAGRLLSLHEAADVLGVHYMTVYRYVRTGRIAAVKDGVEWRVDPAHIARLNPGRPTPRRQSSKTWPWERLAGRMEMGDEAGSWALIESVLASGADPVDIHLRLLAPAMKALGDRWESGRATIGEEHRASGVAIRLVARLGPRFARRGRTRGAIVVGAAPGDGHGLPVAMLADQLRWAGFDVVALGADTPAESFAEAAEATGRLVAVLIGATASGLGVGTGQAVNAVRQTGTGVPVLVGGAGVPRSQARRLRADGWSGLDAQQAVSAVELLAQRAR